MELQRQNQVYKKHLFTFLHSRNWALSTIAEENHSMQRIQASFSVRIIC
uniref:Uncharacterized protein n=1 Tax=Arundo donax TaxID=35708 RepID=A0A0A8YU65_ARUDO